MQPVRYLFFALLFLSLSACGSSHESHSTASTGSNTAGVQQDDASELGANDSSSVTTSEVNQISVNVWGGTENYRYLLMRNSCSTGEHNIEGFRAFCDALKDEALNNGCAKPQRKRAFKQYRCSGEFTQRPRDEEPPNVLSSDKVQPLYLDPSALVLEVVSSSGGSAGELAIIKCDSKANSSGFTLWPSSRALVIRNLNYRFKNGSSNKGNKPFGLIECSGAVGSQASATVGRVLHPGEMVSEVIRTSPAHYREVLKEKFNIRCSLTNDTSILDGKGIVLFPGSTLIATAADQRGDIVIGCAVR